MIHGNNGSISNFKRHIAYYAETYQVILADSRAQGKSVDVGDSLTYEIIADDLNVLLNTLKLDSCYVIGGSDGGIEGLLLAIRHPEKVQKLAITGANLWPDTSAIEPAIHQWVVARNDSLARLSLTPEVKTQLKLVNLLMNEPHISTAELANVHCPTLVIGGDHDVILPKHTMAIAQAIPQSYLWILPNSGHSTLMVYRDMFNQVVSDFFRKPYRRIQGLVHFR